MQYLAQDAKQAQTATLLPIVPSSASACRHCPTREAVGQYGEVADYVSLAETDDAVICTLAHCKGASGKKSSKPKKAATRVDDAYEIAGQVVKCLPFSRQPDELKSELVRRIATGSKLVRGTVEQLELILENAATKRFEYRICLVQPGLSASTLNDSVESVLAAAGEYIIANAGVPPSIWISP